MKRVARSISPRKPFWQYSKFLLPTTKGRIKLPQRQRSHSMHKFSFSHVVSAAGNQSVRVLLFVFPNVDVNLPTILTQQTTPQTSPAI